MSDPVTLPAGYADLVTRHLDLPQTPAVDPAPASDTLIAALRRQVDLLVRLRDAHEREIAQLAHIRGLQAEQLRIADKQLGHANEQAQIARQRADACLAIAEQAVAAATEALALSAKG